MIRRGSDYIKSIKERQPATYYDGKLVEDVTTHPAFKIPIRTVAEYYDLHWKDEYAPYLRTYNKDVGEETSITLARPKTKEELKMLRAALTKIYDYYYGYFGRSPDYINVWSAVFYAHADDYFARIFGSKYAENVLEIYREHARGDWFYTHAIVAPAYDRSRPPSKWENPYIMIRVVRETPEGVVLRGAAMISTAGPYAEYLYYLPNLARDKDPAYAVMFSLPTNTKGVYFLARRGFQPRDGLGEFEYPLSSRFEESDALLVLDDVLVPWDRVMFYGKPEEINQFMWHRVQLRTWLNWHFTIQHYSRLKFLAGLAIAVAESVGIDNFVNVQEKLGEILIYLHLAEAAIVASEEMGTQLESIYRPNTFISMAASFLNMKALPRVHEILRLIAAGASIPVPASIKDLENPEEQRLVDTYLAVKGLNAVERIKLFNILWDVIGSEAGMRYEQYDRFSRGDPTVWWAKFYSEVYKEKKSEMVKTVKQLMDQMPNPRR
jgi:4-hydroxyphenylacetate 3-monooxygenase